jgi:hypothetical protein
MQLCSGKPSTNMTLGRDLKVGEYLYSYIRVL